MAFGRTFRVRMQIVMQGLQTLMSGGHTAASLLLGSYQHQTVNHSQNFVDPGTGVVSCVGGAGHETSTGAHTNSVEGYWSCVKRQMRRQGVMNTSND